MMHAAATIVRWRWRMALHAIREAGWAQRTVAATFLALGAALMAGVYLVSTYGFRALLSDVPAGPFMLWYVLEAAFGLVFILSVASFVMTSRSLLFGASEPMDSLAWPVKPRMLFAARFFFALIASIWPVLLIALPCLAALGAVLGDATFVAIALPITIVFIVFCATVGALIALTLAISFGAFAPAVERWSALLLSLAAVVGFGRHVLPRGLFTMFVVGPGDTAPLVERIQSLFGAFPSHWFAGVIASAVPGVPSMSRLAVISAAATALAFCLLAVVARFAYLSALQRRTETAFTAAPDDPSRTTVFRAPFPAVLRWGHGYLFEKDVRGFLRDGDDLARAAGLGLLLFATIGAARMTAGEFLAGDALPVPGVLAFLFAAIGYFIVTFALRFVLPALALDARGSWLLWACPVHPHELFSWKLFHWSSVVCLLSGVGAFAAASAFDVEPLLLWSFVVAAVGAGWAMTALALAGGTATIGLRERDPDVIATSPAGLLVTAVGAGYIAIMARYIHSAASGGNGVVAALAGMTIVTLAVGGASWIYGSHAIDLKEVR